jgi:hypothetical protein
MRALYLDNPKLDRLAPDQKFSSGLPGDTHFIEKGFSGTAAAGAVQTLKSSFHAS